MQLHYPVNTIMVNDPRTYVITRARQNSIEILKSFLTDTHLERSYTTRIERYVYQMRIPNVKILIPAPALSGVR
ncbi:MAG: hypothetical protein H7069_04060 [Phormidesmis sp. FL-bin-119]|nr:hypothetical protein [Pedobacter sp.]